ncbi:MAG: TonB family protein, partial [Pyrinomonadaceae bacterium]
ALAGKGETDARAYFSLAGQLIKGVRSRLDRYREFGLNAASGELPTEARSDVDQMRTLLERVVAQAKSIRNESANGAGKARRMDATALLEEAAAVRLALARGDQERTDWQREVAEARQRLVANDAEVAGNGQSSIVLTSNVRAATASASPAVNSGGGNGTAAPAGAATTPGAGSQAAAASRPAAANETAKVSSSSPSGPASQQQQSATKPEGDGGGTNKSLVSVGSLHDRATEKVSPTYPPAAKNMRLTGVVTVYVVVDKDGAVEKVEQMMGPSLLQQAAADAARRWKFKPTVVEGQPVRVAGFINFNFSL